MKFKIPFNWTEENCFEKLDDLTKQSSKFIKNEKYDDASKCFLICAYILKELPTIKRRQKNRDDSNKSIKDLRKKKLEENLNDGIINNQNNPFGK